MSYAKLKGKIKEVYGTQDAFATAMGVDRSTMSLKLNNKSSWSSTEIENACNLLDIPANKIHIYFFTLKVEKSRLN